MTLVAACRFRDGAVILADSRATWLRAGVVEDTLQKVLYVGPRTGLAFAGSVDVAACVTEALRNDWMPVRVFGDRDKREDDLLQILKGNGVYWRLLSRHKKISKN
jgi:hypothetical protein